MIQYNHDKLSLIKQPTSAIELFSKQLENHKIITMCQKFDEMLGGGISCGKLTEICGHAGMGKTQICFQTCITAQMPKCLGGMNGDVIYIDTEGSFNTNRILIMAKYTLAHYRKIAQQMNLSFTELNHINKLTEQELLDSIFYFRCTEQIQLLSLSYRLHHFCESHPQVRLIMIDSIAFHFRYDCTDIPKRNRVLAIIGENLTNVASQFGVAVILTNQMTTRFVDGEGHSVPALGESWGHVCHIRILLQKQLISSTKPGGGYREAVLLKHLSQPVSSSFYQITIGGIRNITS